MEATQAVKKGGGKLKTRPGRPRSRYTTEVMGMKKGDQLNYPVARVRNVRNAVSYTTRDGNFPNRRYSTFSDGDLVFVTRKK